MDASLDLLKPQSNDSPGLAAEARDPWKSTTALRKNQWAIWILQWKVLNIYSYLGTVEYIV